MRPRVIHVFRIFANLKKVLYLIIPIAAIIAACQRKTDEEAEHLLSKIEEIYQQGDYKATLDSIESLRIRYPKAIEARKRCLVLWQEASLKQAQEEIAQTDSALQVTLQDFNVAQKMCETSPTYDNLLRRNTLGVKRDSLQARYDAMCALVRVIRQRQKDDSTH